MTPHTRKAEIRFFAAVLVFAALMSLFSYLFEQFVKAIFPEGQPPLVYFILLLVCIGPLYLFYHHSRNRIFSVFGSSVQLIRDPEPRPFLIVGMSPLNQDLDVMYQELEAIGANAVARNLAGYRAACEGASRKREPIRSNWQQIVRTVWYHRKALKEVFVLDNGKGEFTQFRDYLLSVMKNECEDLKVTLITDPDSPKQPFVVRDGDIRFPVDYENYRYCDEGLRRGLAMVAQQLSGQDIDRLCCIDVTAGIKVFSIAAGSITFNREIIFSYANNSGDIVFYNARLIFKTDHTFLPA